MRHLKRNHKEENEVEAIFRLPKNSKERRRAFALFRNDTNFDLYINGVIKPNRRNTNGENTDNYYPCAYCKGLYLKNYLKRHAKACFLYQQSLNRKQGNTDHLSNSQTVTACAMDPTNVISKLNVKEKVFNVMKGDAIAFEAKKDLLIAHFGESYLKKHKRDQMAYACSNRMRELSRLLISYRKIVQNKDVAFKDILRPRNFDSVILAVKEIAGYDHVQKTFRAPSLPMHLGTSLKLACEELSHLILRHSKGYQTKSTLDEKTWLEDVNNFKELVKSRWNTELASLANKDLMEKRWNKPILLPLVSDIQKFRDQTLKIANKCQEDLLENDENEKAYKLLVHSTLSLLILFNRRRIGDVQYLKIKDYQNERRTNTNDFEKVLTNTEKLLTTKYKRVLNSGKGSRAVVILVPEVLQKCINLLLTLRGKHITDVNNEYVFAIPRSNIKWGKGDVSIKKLCKMIKLEHPEYISSNKLRKHIATVMQILNLSGHEAKQFSKFMGHTQKTHDEFYELPIDIYQTAKVSKLLLLMEKGSVPAEFKGKSLSEIDINLNIESVEENNINDDEGVIFLENTADKTNNEEESVSSGEVTMQQTSINLPNFPEGSDDSGNDVPAKRKTVPSGPTQNSDESDEEVIIKKKKAPGTRQAWTKDELKLLEEEFAFYIRSNTYPPGSKIKEFILKTNVKRSVMVIKSKLQHLKKQHTEK